MPKASLEVLAAFQARSLKIIQVWGDELCNIGRQGRVFEDAATELTKVKSNFDGAMKANTSLLVEDANNRKSIKTCPLGSNCWRRRRLIGMHGALVSRGLRKPW